MNTQTETPRQAANRLAGSMLSKGYQFEALHEYTDTDGNPIYWRIRLKNHETSEKWIRPLRLCSSQYELKDPEFANGKPLYRLHSLASHPNEAVFIVEGEACADALAQIGVIATTSGSADSATKADWSPLAGREVVIWPDNDEPGQRYAQMVIKALAPLGCKTSIVSIQELNLPPKGDVVDWLKANPSAKAAEVFALPKEEVIPPVYKESTDDALARLAAMSPLEYERVREDEAQRLGVRLSILDQEVEKLRKKTDDTGADTMFPAIRPWAEPIEPAEVLSEIYHTIRRFIVCNPETANAAALWIAMTWFIDVFDIAPLAVISAPEKRCGKTLLLTIIGRLVSRALHTSNITPAALFRSTDAWHPTLLIDETDAFMRDNNELRGLLNCGHTRDLAYIWRMDGDALMIKRFCVWGAKALAGIGTLPDTIMDRAVRLKLRRKLPDEKVERLRMAEPHLFINLQAKLAKMQTDYFDAVKTARPALPQELNDRAQDNWEPLLAIADVAGGVWPGLAREAALKISDCDTTQSMGTRLLADIKAVFDTKNTERISTSDLLKALCEDEEKPWATFNKDNALTARQLGNMLETYDIKSRNLRFGGQVLRGFTREQFDEAFASYLADSDTSAATPLQVNNYANYNVADDLQVQLAEIPSATDKPSVQAVCSTVADQKAVAANAEHIGGQTC